MLALAVTSAHSRALLSAEAYLVSDAVWYSFTLCLHHLQQAQLLSLYQELPTEPQVFSCLWLCILDPDLSAKLGHTC